MKTSKKIVVYYHKGCRDGFVGAGIAKMAFKNKAEYVPMPFTYTGFKKLRNKTIFFIDAVPLLKDFLEIHKSNEVIIIDHHPTAAEQFKVQRKGLYNLNYSGAGLAWKYFFPKKKMPRLVSEVQKSDLWQRQTEGQIGTLASASLELTSLDSVPKLIRAFEDKKKLKQYEKEGQKILAREGNIVESAVESSVPIIFEGQKARFTYGISALRTHIGAALYEKFPGTIAVVVYLDEGRPKVSMRAKVGTKTDVMKIAKKYGGGGHRYSAGFHWHINKPFPWKYKN